MKNAPHESLREAWLQFDADFSTAEYAIKICEHVNAALDIEAMLVLSRSAKYALSALEKDETQHEQAIDCLNRASRVARKSTKQSLIGALIVLGDMIGDIKRKSGDAILAVHIENYSTHKDNISDLLAAQESIQKGSFSRKRDFFKRSRGLITNALEFLDEYSVKASFINKDLIQNREKNKLFFKKSIKAVFVGILASAFLSVVLEFLLYLQALIASFY